MGTVASAEEADSSIHSEGTDGHATALHGGEIVHVVSPDLIRGMGAETVSRLVVRHDQPDVPELLPRDNLVRMLVDALHNAGDIGITTAELDDLIRLFFPEFDEAGTDRQKKTLFSHERIALLAQLRGAELDGALHEFGSGPHRRYAILAGAQGDESPADLSKRMEKALYGPMARAVFDEICRGGDGGVNVDTVDEVVRRYFPDWQARSLAKMRGQLFEHIKKHFSCEGTLVAYGDHTSRRYRIESPGRKNPFGASFEPVAQDVFDLLCRAMGRAVSRSEVDEVMLRAMPSMSPNSLGTLRSRVFQKIRKWIAGQPDIQGGLISERGGRGVGGFYLLDISPRESPYITEPSYQIEDQVPLSEIAGDPRTLQSRREMPASTIGASVLLAAATFQQAEIYNGPGQLQDEDPEDWRAQAPCAGTDPEAFFPDKGGSPWEAKSVCGACAVKLACLAEALEGHGSFGRFGIWGGTTGTERRKLMRWFARNRVNVDGFIAFLRE